MMDARLAQRLRAECPELAASPPLVREEGAILPAPAPDLAGGGDAPGPFEGPYLLTDYDLVTALTGARRGVERFVNALWMALAIVPIVALLWPPLICAALAIAVVLIGAHRIESFLQEACLASVRLRRVAWRERERCVL